MGGHKRYHSDAAEVASTAASTSSSYQMKKSPFKYLGKPLSKAKYRFHRRAHTTVGAFASPNEARTESTSHADERTHSHPHTRGNRDTRSTHATMPDHDDPISDTARTVPVSNITTSLRIDNGDPSSSSLEDLRRVLRLIEDERHLVAHKLLLDAKRRIREGREQREMEREKQIGRSPRKKGALDTLGIPTWGWRDHSSGENGSGVTEQSSLGKLDIEEASIFLEEKKEEFEALENRAKMFISAKENLTVDDDWIFAQNIFGITTHYRREADGSLSVKIEGELHGVPLFEQMVVLREVDLYHTWAPFMQKSRKLAQLNKLDVVAWYLTGLPLIGLTRDVCYRAVGCDCMREDGSMLLVAVGLHDSPADAVKETVDVQTSNKLKDADSDVDPSLHQQLALGQTSEGGPTSNVAGDTSPNKREQTRNNHQRVGSTDSVLIDTSRTSFLTRDAILETIEIPPVPNGIGHGRMTIRNFVASIDVLGPTSARTKMVVNADPNLHFIPQSLIDFCMKRMCGVLLSRLQATARKVVKDPVKNPHSRRMREDVRFYRDWLLPKFRLYCDELNWQMPPVGAFEVSEEDLEAEGIFEGWRADSSITSTSSFRGDSSVCNSVALGRQNSISSSSTGSQKGRMGKLGHLLHEHELRAAAKRDEKILVARQKAAEILQPPPFSQSKLTRLKELKNAKVRAEDRAQVKSTRSMCASVGGSSLSGSVGSQSNCSDVNDESESLRHDGLILLSSLAFNLALLPFRSHAASNTPFSVLGYLFSDLASRALTDLFALFMIALQSVSLWSLLNFSLVFAFESIDFGQKELVNNLDYGKKLYIATIREWSSRISVSITVISIGLAALNFFFQSSVRMLCTSWGGGAWLEPSFLKFPFLQSSGLNATLNYINQLLRGALSNTLEWVHCVGVRMQVATALRHVENMCSWILSKSVLLLPGSRKDVSLTSSEFFSVKSGIFWLHVGTCDSKRIAPEHWTRRALSISSFITTRLAIFIVALLLLARMVLPKPKKRAPNSDGTSARRAPRKISSDYSLSKSVSVGAGVAWTSSTSLTPLDDVSRDLSLARSASNAQNSNNMDAITEE